MLPPIRALCPIIVMIDGIEKLPQGDPIRELLWMPLEMPSSHISAIYVNTRR